MSDTGSGPNSISPLGVAASPRRSAVTGRFLRGRASPGAGSAPRGWAADRRLLGASLDLQRRGRGRPRAVKRVIDAAAGRV